jgi:hypothetical protein
MRHLLRLLVAVLAFAIGVAVSPIRFELKGMGCGKMIDGGGGFGIRTYRSSDNVELYFASGGYASTEKTNEVFDRQVGEATQVLELTPKLDANGKEAGRRAVVIFLDKETNENYASVIWTDGWRIVSIDSPSLWHVLEFEKRKLYD